MTIVEAVIKVLEDGRVAMTSHEIYEKILDNRLYVLPAKKPEAVVNSMIRRHCLGLDYPTAHPIKNFKIDSYVGKKPRFTLNTEPASAFPLTHPTKADQSELLPEEKIQMAYRDHISSLGPDLMQRIFDNHPSFFENLIVDLLIKMGYGYDRTSGIVVGGPHDGGIDGIIYEDKLGLDLIYLQAKRYNLENNVGIHEIQAFVGAMQNVQKGVFITTSGFTKDAQKYAEQQQQKSLKMIDGKTLISLMIKYEVGITVEKVMKIYRIDASYFE